MNRNEEELDRSVENMLRGAPGGCRDPLLNALSRLPKDKPSDIAAEIAVARMKAVVYGKTLAAHTGSFLGNLALAGAAAAVVLTVTGLTSQKSMPGDMLYPVKILEENVKSSMITAPKQNTKYQITRAKTRLSEIAATAKKGGVVKEEAVALMHKHSSQAVKNTYELPAPEAAEILENLQALHAAEMAAFSSLRSAAGPERYEYIDSNMRLCDDRREWISQLREGE